MATPPLTAWNLESDSLLPARAVGRWLLGGVTVLYALALLLVTRRAMGAFTVELPWPQLLTTALATLAIITGLRIAWRRAYPEPVLADPWIGWGSSLTLALIAGALSMPADALDWAIWLPVLAIDQVVRWRVFDLPETAEVNITNQVLGQNECQRIVRTQDAAGKETIDATLRADFVAGQRNATVYVGFCPPLTEMPEITVDPIDGANTKIVQALRHGARIDVRLVEVARSSTRVLVRMIARA